VIGIIRSQLGKRHYGRYQKIQTAIGRPPTENGQAFLRESNLL
jgi:hypothetical protein